MVNIQQKKKKAQGKLLQRNISRDKQNALPKGKGENVMLRTFLIICDPDKSTSRTNATTPS